MSDPLAQVIGLLRPSASVSKLVEASGRWAVRPRGAKPFYGAILEGECELSIVGRPSVRLARGDFLCMAAARELKMTSLSPPPGGCSTEPVEVRPGVFHLGAPGAPDVRMLIGHCTFGSDDVELLVPLLPDLVIARDERRLSTLVALLSEEARAERPGREVVLAHLLQVLLIEAFRSASGTTAGPGLLRGLGDERLGAALRQMHAEPARAWTVDDLAKAAGHSRSTFFERFRREVGARPMEYLLGWRMALAKELLRSDQVSVGEVAQRVGYSSQSTFSTAFTRYTGTSPRTYARERTRSADRSIVGELRSSNVIDGL